MQTLSSHHIDARDNQQYTWPHFTNKDLKIPFEIDAGIPLSQNFILIFNFSSIYAICNKRYHAGSLHAIFDRMLFASKILINDYAVYIAQTETVVNITLLLLAVFCKWILFLFVF